MSFLSAKSIDALNDLGHLVDREISMSKSDNAIETEWARQAHFIEWCQKKQMKDVCGNQPGWMRIIACYGKDLMVGTNWNNKKRAEIPDNPWIFQCCEQSFPVKRLSCPC